MIIKILWIIMVNIITFAFGFCTGCSTLCSKIYDAMTEALDNVSIEENGRVYVKGVLYTTMKIDEAIKKEKENEECQ